MLFFEKTQQLWFGVVLERNAVADVGAIKSGDELPRLAQVQPRDDLDPGAGVCGGGQGDARNMGEALMQQAQLQVIRAKIVSPLGYAVCLVDGEQRDRGASFQQAQAALLGKALGGNVEQVQFAGQ